MVGGGSGGGTDGSRCKVAGGGGGGCEGGGGGGEASGRGRMSSLSSDRLAALPLMLLLLFPASANDGAIPGPSSAGS